MTSSATSAVEQVETLDEFRYASTYYDGPKPNDRNIHRPIENQRRFKIGRALQLVDLDVSVR